MQNDAALRELEEILSPESKTQTRLRHPILVVLTYIVTGLILPGMAFLTACLWYGRFREIAEFPARLFAAGYNYFLIGCFNAIPFVAIGVFAVINTRIHSRSRSRDLALVVAEIISLVLSASYQMAAWFNMMGPHSDSLIGVAFLMLPALVTVVSIVMGLSVWAISAMTIHR